MAQKIIEREGLHAAGTILNVMGIQIQDGLPVVKKDPVL
jgi:hypothetical protein